MIWRKAAKYLYLTTTTAGGIIGLNKGITIAENNRCPYYDKLSPAGKCGENFCAFMIITATTSIGGLFIPPLVLTSPVWYPFASQDVKEIFELSKK